jgi:hypothetical protein
MRGLTSGITVALSKTMQRPDELSKVFWVFIVMSALGATESTALAQTIETGTKPAVSPGKGRRYGGVGFFMPGAMILDQKEMNEAFAARGYPELPSTLFTLGGGAYFRFNRLLLGIEGFGAPPRSASSATHEISVSGGGGLLDVGYIVANWGPVTIFPMLGMGGAGLGYTLVRKAPASFDQVLDDPARAASLSTGGFLGQLALGVDYMFETSTSPNEIGGALIGLRIGYATQLPRGNWSLFGAGVAGGPDVGFGGPFLRLVIGGGGAVVD